MIFTLHILIDQPSSYLCYAFVQFTQIIRFEKLNFLKVSLTVQLIMYIKKNNTKGNSSLCLTPNGVSRVQYFYHIFIVTATSC